MATQFFSVKQAYNLAVGTEITLRGWARSRRDSKGVTFIELNDGSRFKSMQLVVDAGTIPEDTLETNHHRQQHGGDRDTGRVAGQGTGGGVESGIDSSLRRRRSANLSAAEEAAHARVPPRDRPPAAAATPSARRSRVRNALSHAIHQFFQERGFLYIHTPIITADCEGAGADVPRDDVEPAKPPRTDDGKIDWQQDFFGKPAYLTVSGQLEGEIFACALGKVYTFGPTFRAENSNTSRHLAEFWMVEPEMAFYELDDNMDLAEEFLKRIIRDVLDHCPEDMEFFNERIDKTVLATLEHVVASDFGRLTYTEAVDDPEKVRQDVGVSRRVGQRPAGRARALPDRRRISRSR